ncbi:MAG: AMP-binding protein [Actinomycetota bacterium]
MSDWNFAAVWHGIAGVAPERDAIVCGERRRTFGEFDERAARLASHLHEAGLRAGDKVAIDLVNRPEYLETFFAALDLGCVPVNVNYRYLAPEVRYVLDNSDARAVVHGAEFADVVADAVAGLDHPPLTLEVGESYEQALAAAPPDGPWQERAPVGDDLMFLYTGGTTGMPKGVMWRTDDLYVALWQMGRPGTEPPDPVAAAEAGKRTGTCLPACPLMHGTGLFIALSTLAGGGTVVLIDGPGLDPARVWSEVERNAVQVLTIVGDVFARPLLAALDAEPSRWDLSGLQAITSSGVTWSPETKQGLLKHVPHVTLIDSLGASEGMMTRTASRASDEIRPARFAVSEKVKVFDEHTDREVTPGSEEVGLVGVGGRIPLGYWKDPDKTAATFRTVAGGRYSIPGDYASVDADGTIRLLGRGSACINTGGEKVYPEEVELLLRQHPGVHDCVVVGVPDERFGEMVVALVQPSNDATDDDALDEDELRAFCKGRTAGYKRPKRYLLLDDLQRSAAGKANYALLRAIAAERIERA